MSILETDAPLPAPEAVIVYRCPVCGRRIQGAGDYREHYSDCALERSVGRLVAGIGDDGRAFVGRIAEVWRRTEGDHVQPVEWAVAVRALVMEGAALVRRDVEAAPEDLDYIGTSEALTWALEGPSAPVRADIERGCPRRSRSWTRTRPTGAPCAA